MGMSTDVRLPSSLTPVFPLRCVHSDEMHPDSDAGVVAHKQNPFLHFLAPIMMFFGWRRVRVPVFRRHRMSFYVQVYGRNLITLAIIVVVLAIFMPMIEPGTPWRKFKIVGLAMLALLPWALFETLFPPRFDVTVYDDFTDYKFASAQYAADFAEINAEHVIGVSRPPA
jgi:hypothetical protein